MEDRFRLRAWLLDYERMVDVGVIDFARFHSIRFAPIYLTDDGKPILNECGQVIDSASNPKSMEHLSKCILMQCTGLKDKNGRLIYEGDIVATSNQNPKYDLWDKETFGYTAISWNKKDTCFCGSNWFIDDPEEESVFNAKFVEIIGNIHENPELLEDGNEANH